MQYPELAHFQRNKMQKMPIGLNILWTNINKAPYKFHSTINTNKNEMPEM
jgi:hypothetical protein